MELTVEIIDGKVILNKYQEYYLLAEGIANDLCIKLFGEYDQNKWIAILKYVIKGLASNSKKLKSQIVTDVSYAFNLHSVTSERIDKPFKEAKAYIEGFNDATTTFNKVFKDVEISIESSLNKFLP